MTVAEKLKLDADIVVVDLFLMFKHAHSTTLRVVRSLPVACLDELGGALVGLVRDGNLPRDIETGLAIVARCGRIASTEAEDLVRLGLGLMSHPAVIGALDLEPVFEPNATMRQARRLQRAALRMQQGGNDAH